MVHSKVFEVLLALVGKAAYGRRPCSLLSLIQEAYIIFNLSRLVIERHHEVHAPAGAQVCRSIRLVHPGIDLVD